MTSIHNEVKQSVEATRLPEPLVQLIKRGSLIKQGAEAKVYKTTLYPSPSITLSSSSSSPPPPSSPPSPPWSSTQILLKHRFPKRYRHPTLDVLLTRQRLTSESRALVRAQKAGVRVPGLRLVDLSEGVLGIEWVEGWSVREVLGGGQEGDELPEEEAEGDGSTEEEEEEEDVGDMLRQRGVDEDTMLHLIGREIAKLHLADIIHGDLTTSNMMVRLLDQPRPGRENEVFEVVIIDFGLSLTSPMSEERAVDLYVLERAFSSTHPVSPASEPHFERVLEGYRQETEEAEGMKRAKKGTWEGTRRRLEEVRGRGRKRSMVG
ncbi:hypothetical protein JCM11641_005263 [Rhodosporidiobolus odoratus]